MTLNTTIIDLQRGEKEREVNKKELKKELTESEASSAPDGGWGWVVVASSFFACLMYDGITYSFGVLTTEFIDHFNLSRTFVGFIGSLLVGMTLSIGPLASVLCNRYGHKLVMIFGGLLSSVSFSLPFFLTKLWVLVLTSVLTGIGFGMIYLASVVIVNTYFDKKRGLAVGIAICGSGLGTFIMSPVIEFLIENYGWQGAMLITGGILLNVIPCGLLYRPLPLGENCITSSSSKECMSKESEKQTIAKVNEFRESLSSTFRLFKKPVFLLFGISNFLSSIGFNAPYLYAKDRALSIGISSVKSSFLISSIGIGSCLGRLVFGYLSTTRFFNRFHLYNFSLFISGAVLIISWDVYLYELMIAYTFVFGLMSGTFVTLTSLVLVDFLGLDNLGNAFGIINIIQGIAVFIGPALAGYVYDSTESFNAAFVFCGVFLSISGLMMNFAYFSKNFKEKLKSLNK